MASMGRRLLLSAGAAGLGLPGIARAQTWRPTQPLRVIVSAAPGGTIDLHARAVQPILAQKLGVAVVVENQGGAAGRVAAMQMGRAPADARNRAELAAASWLERGAGLGV